MNRPDFLYHGSDTLVDVLEPRDSLIYAARDRNICIPFALAFRPDERGRCKWDLQGVSPDGATVNPRIILEQGWLDTTGIGYLYRLPADSFEDRRWQWVSYAAVKPIDHEIIRSVDYVSWIVGEVR